MHPIYPMTDGTVRMKPLGVVRSPVNRPQTGGLTKTRATVEIDPGLEPLLDGFDEFSHLWVMFWMTEVREHSVARRPQGRDDVPVLGLLATR
jgi:tRNA (adenine37-N6)-methyltransferase